MVINGAKDEANSSSDQYFTMAARDCNALRTNEAVVLYSIDSRPYLGYFCLRFVKNAL
jgi:hypothetical protein